MKSEINIFNSELEFRNHVILNSKRISQIYVFEDILDSIIFFYCFLEDYSVFATKEASSDHFSYYREIYTKLASKYQLKVIENFKQPNSLKLAN